METGIEVVVEKSIADCIRECINYEVERMKNEGQSLEQTFADNIKFLVRILRAIEEDESFRYEFYREVRKIMHENGYKNIITDSFSGIYAAIIECSCVDQFRQGLWH